MGLLLVAQEGTNGWRKRRYPSPQKLRTDNPGPQ